MKIALVCTKYSLEKGGLERYTVLLSRGLLRAGHEVHVFANTWQEEPGIVFHRVPRLRLSSPGKNLSFAYFSKRLLSKYSFDVIHSMERIFYQDIFRASDGINPIQLLQKYSNPLIRKLKSIGPRRIALSYLEHKIFSDKGSRFIMTNSELVKGHIVKYYKVDPGRITVIYNGVDTSKFHPGVRERYRKEIRAACGIKKDDPALLFISNDFKRKNLQSVLEAVFLLKDKKIRLMVVGNDNVKPHKRWVSKNGLENNVLFLGRKSIIEKYYAASDIFILPTLEDAFANVCLEAMACGVPVITTKTNGASELIVEGEHGYILNTREPKELAERIKALESSTKRRQLGENAANKASFYTMEKHLSKVIELYERVTNQGNPQ